MLPANVSGIGKSLISATVLAHPNDEPLYTTLLEGINEQQEINSILMLHHGQRLPATILKAVGKIQIPQLIVTKNQATFLLKKKFNTEILSIVVMSSLVDYELMKLLADLLYYVRQTRILNIALDVLYQEEYKEQFLFICQQYNMTNVLLQFMQTKEEILSRSLYMLKPYPQYHWEADLYDVRSNKQSYYQQHWRNMYNKTLKTYVDESDIRSLYYEDTQGHMQLNGYVARFVLLFAQLFNASLQMAFPLSITNPTHDSVILEQMVRKNLLDVPMILDTTTDGHELLPWTDVYEFDQGLLMVPCAQKFTTQEVYGILLNIHFMACVISSTVLLSLAHSLIDYVYDDFLQLTRLLLSDRILPGVLGQAFKVRASKSGSLKIIYLLLFIVGLYINTQFSAKVNTLFTRPPYHQQIESMQDVVKSPKKVLLYEANTEILSIFMRDYQSSFITTKNYTYMRDMLLHLNTTYSYYTSSGLWDILMQQQQFYSHPAFCTYDNLTLFKNLLWAIPLQPNSPYKDALNHLIHQVHDFGFMHAWVYSTLADMLKLRLMSLRDPYVKRGPMALNVNDLFWIWIMVIMGFVASCMVFLLEIIVGCLIRNMKIMREKRVVKQRIIV
ncbi:uncharacterized protein LOC131998454 [Stomoxys calcitrans]|uniref:uncharacterized protein LOC131998454 n=1 Tax=Stomoxys calcitrans TaxID=35570 RepID=UPI0027E2B2F0|nr:uncharacterized protein LOC131998454 [Stomoxys calcitrans]